MQKLFVYGTLKQQEVQKKVFGRIAKSQDDTLSGFKKGNIEVNGSTYPMAILEKEATIEGIVINVKSDELALIDKYETPVYRRTKVKLLSGQTAWVYCR